ncbi:MAG TPA: PKD domain-containing protein, partial [Chitinophagaceae bacterium]|nr:PKD domain-containing protein [Chitinophagaceae bacterium]
VKRSPVLNGFLLEPAHTCGAPLPVQFRDTSKAAVSWEWKTEQSGANFRSADKAPAYTFDYGGTYYVYLKITDAAGCTAQTTKTVDVYAPTVTIQSPDERWPGDQSVASCGPKDVRFTATGTQPIKKYLWDFGDGTTSAEAAPVHPYKKKGHYLVKLTYTTEGGCTGTADFRYGVQISERVKVDFTASQTQVCGQTQVTFTNQSGPTVYYSWNFGDGYFQASTGEGHMIQKQFWEEGTYTVGLIATDGVCADTLVKKDYIKVTAPFPKISGYTTTCEGTRGEVTFTQESRKTDSWHWDFGDGTKLDLTTDQREVKHTYKKTGHYWVTLTNKRGGCRVEEKLLATVVLRQKPLLAVDKPEICMRNEALKITVSNLESNNPNNWDGHWNYGIVLYDKDWNHLTSGVYGASWLNGSVELPRMDFYQNHDGIRAIVTSGPNGCADTTSLQALKIKGPMAGFRQNIRPCAPGGTVYLQDTSVINPGKPIVKWEWNWHDNSSNTYTKPGEVSHTYFWPSEYPVYLTVTDAAGCSNTTMNWVDAYRNGLE